MGEHGVRRNPRRFAGQLAAMLVAASLTAAAFVIPGLVDQDQPGGGKLT